MVVLLVVVLLLLLVVVLPVILLVVRLVVLPSPITAELAGAAPGRGHGLSEARVPRSPLCAAPCRMRLAASALLSFSEKKDGGGARSVPCR